MDSYGWSPLPLKNTTGIDLQPIQNTMKESLDFAHHLPLSNIETAIQMSDSTLIISEAKDLFQFNMLSGKSNIFPYPESMPQNFSQLIKAIQKNTHPDILLVTDSEDYQSFHVIDQTWNHLFEYQISNETNLSQTLLRSYANGPQGVLWIMDEKKDLIYRATKNERLNIPYQFLSERAGGQVRIVFHPHYGLFIVSNSGKIDLISKDGLKLESFMEVELAQENISSLHIEQSGELWIIQRDRLIKVYPEKRKSQTFPQHLFHNINPEFHHIFEDEERISWFCTDIGVLKVNEGVNPFYSILKSAPNTQNTQFREIIPWDSPNSFICRIGRAKRSLIKVNYETKSQYTTETIFDDVPGFGSV